MIKIFDRSVYGHEASRQLVTLRQGRRSAADYAIEFRTLAATCEWNEQALTARFLEGLSGEIKEEILSRDLPICLDQLVELAIRLDKLFELRHRLLPELRAAPPIFSSPAVVSPGPEPIQLGGLRISTAEHQRRITGGTQHVLRCTGAFRRKVSSKREGSYWQARLPFPHLTRLVPPSLPSCAVVALPFPAQLWLTREPRGILWMRTGHSITAFLFRS